MLAPFHVVTSPAGPLASAAVLVSTEPIVRIRGWSPCCSVCVCDCLSPSSCAVSANTQGHQGLSARQVLMAPGHPSPPAKGCCLGSFQVLRPSEGYSGFYPLPLAFGLSRSLS